MMFEWTNRTEVLAALARWPDIFGEEITNTLEKAALLLVGKTADLAPVGIGAGGNLANSIAAGRPVAVAGGWEITYGTTVEHAEAIEYGRTPGSAMPPVDEIARWVWLKGPQIGLQFDTEEQARGLAFVIARNIARRGFSSGPVTGDSGGTAWAMFRRAKTYMMNDIRQGWLDCQRRISLRCAMQG